MLHNELERLSKKEAGGYPLRVSWDGILVDDIENRDDIVRRLREVFEIIWEGQAEAIEEEASKILGVKDLRDYFRKPGKSGFWNAHVSCYSKARRQAPIYWLLQSSKRNYSLWIYYHRLDKDLLFRALQSTGPVQTKINVEQARLDELYRLKTHVGDSGKEAKRVAGAIVDQEELLSELRDFEEKLRRAANLNFGDKDKIRSDITYAPDLNDGVILNIAPLHELVPWKEARNCWEELLEGKYEWSSIGKQLRQKGLVKS
jgi:hypothetical protein